MNPTPQGQVGYCRPPEHSRFKAGQSGNPGGMSKKRRISHAMERLLDLTPAELREYEPKTVAEELALDILRGAKLDARFTTHALDRTEGKVPDQVQLESGPQVLRIAIEPACETGNVDAQGQEPSAEVPS